LWELRKLRLQILDTEVTRRQIFSLLFDHRRMEFDFRGHPVRLSGAAPEVLERVLHSAFVSSWLSSLDSTMVLQEIAVQSWTATPAGLFDCIKISTVSTRFGVRIPRIIVLHGPGALALIVVTDPDSGARHVLFYERPRVATGGFQLEAPLEFTGGAEPDAEFTSAFVNHDLGLRTAPAQFVDLLRATRWNDSDGVRPFVRPSDQRIRFWALEIEMAAEGLAALEGQAVAPNVTVRAVPLEDAGRATRDHKNMAAVLFYEIYEEGKKAAKHAL
jgi:hypothetical protein